MPDEIHSSTFDDHIKKLEEILDKFKDLIPTDGGSSKGEQLHPYGPHNLHLQRENVNEMVENMAKQCKKISSGSNPIAMAKLTSDKQFLSNLVNPLKMTLKAAISRIREEATDTTLKTTLLKLEAISLEEGLRFDCEQMNSNCFISSDMFYIEVILDNCGQANDVKLHGHTGEAKSCRELVQILRKKDYKEFRCHLQGLKSRYILKGNLGYYQTKILSALESLEEDVIKIMKSDITSNMVSDSVMRGPVGYVMPRDGGKNLQMTFMADPLSLLDLANQGVIKVFSQEEPLERSFGYSAILSVRQAELTLLPLSSLVSYEKNTLRYAKQDSSNSEEVPACFVLNLSKPLPASAQTTKMIHKLLNNSSGFTYSSNANLDDLIMHQHVGMSHSDWEKQEFCVELSNEIHIFRCIPSGHKSNIGLLLSCIPFNHPMQLPPLIKILRSQVMYNILLCSCVTKSADSEELLSKKQLNFDVTACSWNTVTVTFIHPIDGSIGSVDFTVSPEPFIECCLNLIPGSPKICSNNYLDKVVNRCLSLPITMRSLFKKAESYKPEMNDTEMQISKEKKTVKPLKLQMPNFANMQSEIPIISPHLLSSPSTFLNFSPGAPLFNSEMTQKGTISKKRTPVGGTPVGTPNSDGSRTPSNKQKLPKITLKRKRNEHSEIYEIDQTKSDFEMDTETPIEKPSDVPFSFTYTQPESDSSKKSQSLFSDTFPNVSLAEGDADLDGLLGITSDSFPHEDHLSVSMPVSASITPFDLDAITSGRDVTFESMPGSIIDPSGFVKTSGSFDIDSSGIIDIDSLMNVVNSDINK